jgi:GNAT superfamily N-acetyltransferase
VTATRQIRLARPAEAAALSDLAIRSKAHWRYDADFMVRARPDLFVDIDWIKAGLVLVAEDERGLAGVAGLERTGPASFDVSVFFVDPDRLGTGVGRSLFIALAGHARGRCEPGEPVRRLTILSDPNAEGFYRRMGAAPIGKQLSVTGRMLPLLSYAL